MTCAYFRQRRHAMAQKVAALLVILVALVAVTDPAPLALQPIVSPATSTTTVAQTLPPSNVPSQPRPSAEPKVANPEGAAPTTVTQTESPGNAPSQRQPLDEMEATGPDGAIDINDLRRELLDYRTEALDYRAKTVDWWLAATAIFLTLLGIVAVIVGYVSFKRFREIEAEAHENMKLSRKHAEEARGLVDEIKARRDEATSVVKEITAEVVHDDPDKAEKAAVNVQDNPTTSPIDQTVATAALLQKHGNIKEAIKKWQAVAVVSEGSDNELAARSWFSVGYLYQKHEKDALETAIDAYDVAIRLNSPR